MTDMSRAHEVLVDGPPITAYWLGNGGAGSLAGRRARRRIGAARAGRMA
jgi:hypothetical protein